MLSSRTALGRDVCELKWAKGWGRHSEKSQGQMKMAWGCLFGRKLREDIRVIFKYLKGYYWEEEFDILAFGLWKGTMRHLETSIPA